jgi:hypothetical protein
VEARYRPSAIEIWNEEDLWAFWYHPNPNAYGKLFDTAQRAVKRVNPGAVVIAGGISQFSPHFLAQVVHADPSFHPDGLAFHGYYQTPTMNLAHFEADADQADALGLRIPIYVDEYGWQTGRQVMPGGTWSVSAAQRRSYMAPILKGFTPSNGRPAAHGPYRPPTPPLTRPRSSAAAQRDLEELGGISGAVLDEGNQDVGRTELRRRVVACRSKDVRSQPGRRAIERCARRGVGRRVAPPAGDPRRCSRRVWRRLAAR